VVKSMGGGERPGCCWTENFRYFDIFEFAQRMILSPLRTVSPANMLNVFCKIRYSRDGPKKEVWVTISSVEIFVYKGYGQEIEAATNESQATETLPVVATVVTFGSTDDTQD